MDKNISYLDAATFNDEQKRVFRPLMVYIGIEAAIAFFGNIIVVFVFKFRYHKCNFRYFVMCLALTDFIASFTTVSGEVITLFYWYDFPSAGFCKTKTFFNVFTAFAEAWCLLVIAVDRYRKVCMPLGWQITPNIAIVLCGIICLLSTILGIPATIFSGTHEEEIYVTNVKLYGYRTGDTVRVNITVCDIDQTYLDQSAPITYTCMLTVLLLLTLIPLSVLCVLLAKTVIGNNSLNKPKCDDRSDSDNKTSDDINACSVHTIGTATGNVLSLNTPACEFQQDGSTINCMKTKQTLEGIWKSPSHAKSSNQTKDLRGPKITWGTSVRKKILLMLVLHTVFLITTIIYVTMTILIATGILDTLSFSEKAVFFFIFRLYFINHVINPFLYGLMDPEFRNAMREAYRKIRRNGCNK